MSAGIGAGMGEAMSGTLAFGAFGIGSVVALAVVAVLAILFGVAFNPWIALASCIGFGAVTAAVVMATLRD